MTAPRPVSYLFYSIQKTSIAGKNLKVVILAPGHGIRNSEYAFIATHLAARGYVVASIQYELPQDEEIEITGNVYEALETSWEQSVTYILFVTQYLKKIYPNLDFEHLTLIGHSRGGDVLMLFAQKYPELVSKAISLDNNHVPLPRTKKPQIFSLRANNTTPDKGVLPTPEEQEKYQIQIIKLKDISHMDMCFGTANQKEEINRYLTEFLQNLN